MILIMMKMQTDNFLEEAMAMR